MRTNCEYCGPNEYNIFGYLFSYKPIHEKLTIAIDGHSSTGKSTLAKERRLLGYIYVDSGAMYRAVALEAFAMVGYQKSLEYRKKIS